MAGSNTAAANTGTIDLAAFATGQVANANSLGMDLNFSSASNTGKMRVTSSSSGVFSSDAGANGVNLIGATMNHSGTLLVTAKAVGGSDGRSAVVRGASVYGGSVMANSGEVRAVAEAIGDSTYATGIETVGSQFANSGKITVGTTAGANSGLQAWAVLGIDSDLYLDAPSYLGGLIDTATYSANNVTITIGASHAILWDLENVDTTTPGLLVIEDDLVPAFRGVDGDGNEKIATFDPTLFASRPQSLADRAGVLQALMRGRRDASDDDQCSGGAGADLVVTPFVEVCAPKPETTIWVGGFGRHMSYDGGHGRTLHVLNEEEEDTDEIVVINLGDAPTLD